MTKIETALFSAFNLSDSKLKAYAEIIGKYSLNEAVLLDAISKLGNKYSRESSQGRMSNIPTAQSILNFYAKLAKEIKQESNPRRSVCGVYCEDLHKHVPNSSEVFPTLSMIKVSLENSDGLEKYIWDDDSAFEYISACKEFYWHKNGGKTKINNELEKVLKKWTNEIPGKSAILKISKTENDIYEDEAVNQ